MYHFFGKEVRWGEREEVGSMKTEQLKKGWQEKSREVNQGMAEWRQAHPRTTFREIEAEVDRRLD